MSTIPKGWISQQKLDAWRRFDKDLVQNQAAMIWDMGRPDQTHPVRNPAYQLSQEGLDRLVSYLREKFTPVPTAERPARLYYNGYTHVFQPTRLHDHMSANAGQTAKTTSFTKSVHAVRGRYT